MKQALDKSEARLEALARGLPPLATMMSRPALLRSSAKMRRQKPSTEANCRCQQTELKQALDKSEARSEALARELASARKNDVAARAAALERENAAQKQTADAKQMELKQALDKSEERALALERESAAQKQTADARQMELKRGV